MRQQGKVEQTELFDAAPWRPLAATPFLGLALMIASRRRRRRKAAQGGACRLHGHGPRPAPAGLTSRLVRHALTALGALGAAAPEIARVPGLVRI